MAHWSFVGRVRHRAVGPDDCAAAQLRRIDVIDAEDVVHLIVVGEEMIGDDPPMAPPPDRLRAHHGRAGRSPAPAALSKPV